MHGKLKQRAFIQEVLIRSTARSLALQDGGVALP